MLRTRNSQEWHTLRSNKDKRGNMRQDLGKSPRSQHDMTANDPKGPNTGF